MPSPGEEELTEFIEDALAAKLRVSAKARRRTAQKKRNLRTILAVIFVPLTVIALYWFGTGGDGESFDLVTLVWLLPAMALASVGAYRFALWRYVRTEEPFAYLPEIVAPLIVFMDPRFKTYETTTISPAIVQGVAGLPAKIEELNADPYFRAEVRGMTWHIGQADCRGEGDRFRGLLFMAEFPEPLENAQQVLDEASELSKTTRVACTDGALVGTIADDAYFTPPHGEASTSTEHLHKIAGELGELIDLTELVEQRRGMG